MNSTLFGRITGGVHSIGHVWLSLTTSAGLQLSMPEQGYNKTGNKYTESNAKGPTGPKAFAHQAHSSPNRA